MFIYRERDPDTVMIGPDPSNPIYYQIKGFGQVNTFFYDVLMPQCFGMVQEGLNNH